MFETKSCLGAELVLNYSSYNKEAKSLVKDLGIFWYNGIEWINLGGYINPIDNIISINTKILSGKFAVRFTKRSSELAVNKVWPRVFSPDENNDIINKCRIVIDNPLNKEVYVNIYDLKGSLIRKALPRESDNVFYWDGRDKDGEVVSSGVYIYQVESDGKVINGTIVVSR